MLRATRAQRFVQHVRCSLSRSARLLLAPWHELLREGLERSQLLLIGASACAAAGRTRRSKRGTSLAARTHPGRELIKIHGPTAGRAKVELNYERRPRGGYVFGALQPAIGEVLTEVYPRRIVGHYTEFLEKVER